MASVELCALVEEVHIGHKGEHWRVDDGLILVHNKVYVPPFVPGAPSATVQCPGARS
jgi:hypothetical protein